MIDFRSDTVTRPDASMRKAMASAEVGDDVFADDPTVNELETRVAEIMGHQSALMVPSGTQSNLIALLTHCGRGEEYIVGQEYHTYYYEAGGAASLGGIQPQPIAVENDGTLDLNTVKKWIKPDDYHFARTRLLSLENTHSGKVISNDYLGKAIHLAKVHNLSVHLDGARVFNAAVAQQIDVQEITRPFDSVSVCFSKGLGAPVGSVLCGSEEFIARARRWRKMVGGGMRQAGILAAAMHYALDYHVDRLALDHQNAQLLQNELSKIDELKVEPANTNMLYIEFADEDIAQRVQQALEQQHILIASGKRVRLVTHLDIDEADVRAFVDALKKLLK
ncbi:MAG: low-specificity L-threonine aldolase [Gammaproteobacteria bacterium]|nr:low-specificity L-threonine aldolase [Gammaproteobacteria bacterium]